MPDRPQSPQSPTSTGTADAWSRNEIDAAIAGLDRATRGISRQVDAIEGLAHARDHMLGQPRVSGPDPGPPIPPPPAPDRQVPIATPTPATPFEELMRGAEREAAEYLEQAKRRADSLVNSMIGAVEREAAEIRHEAERGIRERWSRIESEAGRILQDAKQVADKTVAERRVRIDALSDGIVDRAQSLTNGMDDAERIRGQFDNFIRALSETADQIARESSGDVEGQVTRLNPPASSRGGALAA